MARRWHRNYGILQQQQQQRCVRTFSWKFEWRDAYIGPDAAGVYRYLRRRSRCVASLDPG